MINSFSEAIGCEIEVLRYPTDSVVREGVDGFRTLVRNLRYEVHEGREAGEVVIVPQAFIAKRNHRIILLEVVRNRDEICQD